MKNIFTALLLVLTSFISFAQGPRNEVKWNIGNTIALGSVEVGYEYFLDDHQSVGAEVFINDAYNFSVGRQIKDFNTNSFALSYSYYTAANNKDFVISPFIKVRTGDYQKTDNDPVIDMDSFILGIGGGYKWNMNDKFVFGPYFTVARNFSGEINDEFDTPLEFTLGFGVGYRF